MNNKTPLTPITWETTRVLGSLCHEPKKKKKYIFLVVVLVAQSCQTLCDSMAVAHQAPLSMAFSRQEYWSG